MVLLAKSENGSRWTGVCGDSPISMRLEQQRQQDRAVSAERIVTRRKR